MEKLHKVEKVDEWTDRVRVPNGWLYRTVLSAGVHTVFIKNEEIPKCSTGPR